MLVLTRKQGEVLQIGDHITVTIVDLRNGRVRIGIDARRSIDPTVPVGDSPPLCRVTMI